MEPATDLERRIAGIAALDQPLRRDLYRLLAAADGWVTRDDAASALGVARSVAAFHLDKLAEAGVVEVQFERTSGRQGPGAGRPSKMYRLADAELAASIPERHYDLAAQLLATAVAEATRTGQPVAECLSVAAHTTGEKVGAAVSEAVHAPRRAGERLKAVVDVLIRRGYEPRLDRGSEIVLGNCPFHRLAQEHRELVCGMNLDFVEGLLDGIGNTDRLTARLEPAPGSCCVRIATR